MNKAVNNHVLFFCVNINFHFSGINAQECNYQLYGNHMFSLIGNCQTSRVACHFTFLPATYEYSFFLPVFDGVTIFS